MERRGSEIAFIRQKMSPFRPVIVVLTTLLLGRERESVPCAAAALVGGSRRTCPPAELAPYIKTVIIIIPQGKGTTSGSLLMLCVLNHSITRRLDFY